MVWSTCKNEWNKKNILLPKHLVNLPLYVEDVTCYPTTTVSSEIRYNSFLKHYFWKVCMMFFKSYCNFESTWVYYVNTILLDCVSLLITRIFKKSWTSFIFQNFKTILQRKERIIFKDWQNYLTRMSEIK